MKNPAISNNQSAASKNQAASKHDAASKQKLSHSFLQAYVPFDTRLITDPLINNMLKKEPVYIDSLMCLLQIFAFLMECPNQVGNYRLALCLNQHLCSMDRAMIRIIERYDLFVFNPKTGDFYSRYLRQASGLPADIESLQGFILPKRDLLEESTSR